MAVKRNRRRVAQRSLIAGAIGLAVLFFSIMEYGDSGRVGIPGAADDSSRGARGSFLLEPSGISYNSSGKLMYSWRSESALRESAQEPIRLSGLEYTGGMDRKRGWNARASSGELSADGSTLHMQDDVTITDLLRNLTIETQAMSVDLKKNSARSDTDVLLRTPRGTTTANGMLALPDEGKLELNNRVEGHYNAG